MARVTINTIAKHAGVSRGTVDRVLNQRPHVKPEVYEKVVRAMRALDYIPPNEAQAKALGLDLPTVEFCKLGIILPSERGYFHREIMRGIEDAREYLIAYSVEIIIEECETDLPSETLERIDKLLSKHVSGIAICAKEHKSISKKIDEISSMNIPVVTYNSDISNCNRIFFVGENILRGGRVAGELMSKYLNEDDHLLIAVGNLEFNAHKLRLHGFRERLQENGFKENNQRIIETYNDYSLSYQKILDALESDSKLRGIYMANHSVTGCAEAIRDTGRQGQIHVISHDLTNETKRLLRSGEIDLAISQNIHRQSFRSLIILQEYIQKRISPRLEESTIEIICSENIANQA